MSDERAGVLEVAGIRDINGKSITITEGRTDVQISFVGDRHLSAEHCRRLAQQLYRCARRLEQETPA